MPGFRVVANHRRLISGLAYLAQGILPVAYFENAYNSFPLLLPINMPTHPLKCPQILLPPDSITVKLINGLPAPSQSKWALPVVYRNGGVGSGEGDLGLLGLDPEAVWTSRVRANPGKNGRFCSKISPQSIRYNFIAHYSCVCQSTIGEEVGAVMEAERRDKRRVIWKQLVETSFKKALRCL